jgi:cysteine synthase
MLLKTPIRRKNNILVKLEALQPGSSHKARAARFMIESAIAKGDLKPGDQKRILEKSGGNLGVGLAYEANRHGIGVDLVIGLSFSRIKRTLCEKYGAQVIGDRLLNDGLTPKEVINKLLNDHPNRWLFIDQFNNQANVLAHCHETGPETVGQIAPLLKTGQRLILVKGAGTGASFQGVATCLKGKIPNVSCVLVMPFGCDLSADRFSDHPLEGFAVGVRPPFLNMALIDAVQYVDAASAWEGQRAMAKDIGFYPGASSGANYAAAKFIAETNPDAIILTFAYDSGEAYLAGPAPIEACPPKELVYA